MIKKITSASLSYILLISTFNGCSSKFCNPSNTGFVSGIFCIASGGFDDRIVIFGQRVKIAKDKYFEALLEYQEMVAEITQDNRKIVKLRKNINLMNRHSDKVIKMIDNISTYEKTITNQYTRREAIREEKRNLKEEVNNFTRTLQKVAQASVISIEQKEQVVRKMRLGQLTERQAVVIEKFTGNRNLVLAKVEREVQNKTQKSINLSASLSRNIDNSNSNELKQRGIGLLLSTKSIHKTKEIHVEKRKRLGLEVERRNLGVEVERREYN